MISISRSRIMNYIAFLMGLWIPCTYYLLHRRTTSLSMGAAAKYDRAATATIENFPSKTITSFAFPSRQARLEYYMGDWYGRTLSPGEIPCDEIIAANDIRSDRDVLWRASMMGREIKYNGRKDWLIGSYLVDARDVVKSAKRDSGGIGSWIWKTDNDRSLILHIGDSHSHSTRIPAVAKTRFSRFATRKSTGQHFFASIIFPLEMVRHYEPVKEYIQLHGKGRVCKWRDKKPTLIWRGGVTGVSSISDKKLLTTYVDGGSRINVVRDYYHADTSVIDVAFQSGSPTVEWAPYRYAEEAHLVRNTHTSMEDQMKFKYVLMLEGNDVATGLKWQLASNSVVFMARPTTVSFLMEDMLVPFVHYVPVKDDYSNLIEMVRWARRNDGECKRISERATLFMQELWMSRKAKRENAAIRKELGEIYHRQFGKAIESCASKR